MPKPRFSGGSVSMRVSSSQIAPSDNGSNPAMQLSAVDLPQPDGPSSAMNSPRSMVSVSAFSAAGALTDPTLSKRRVTPARRSCLKSWVMEMFPWERRPRREICAPDSRRGRRPHTRPNMDLLRFRRSDFLVPAAKCFHQHLRVQRLHMRMLREELVVFRAAVFLQHVLAFLGCHGDRDILDRGTGIEITLVVGEGL